MHRNPAWTTRAGIQHRAPSSAAGSIIADWVNHETEYFIEVLVYSIEFVQPGKKSTFGSGNSPGGV